MVRIWYEFNPKVRWNEQPEVMCRQMVDEVAARSGRVLPKEQNELIETGSPGTTSSKYLLG